MVGLGKMEGLVDQINDPLSEKSQLCQRASGIIKGIVLGETAKRSQVRTTLAQELKVLRLHDAPFDRGGRCNHRNLGRLVHKVSSWN